VIAGKCQLVDMPRIVVMPDGFSMSWPVTHAANLTVTPHCWASQQWTSRVHVCGKTRVLTDGFSYLQPALIPTAGRASRFYERAVLLVL
jgi:hypothetical protein